VNCQFQSHGLVKPSIPLLLANSRSQLLGREAPTEEMLRDDSSFPTRHWRPASANRKYTFKFTVENRVPGFVEHSRRADGGHSCDSGVVDQDVDLTELVNSSWTRLCTCCREEHRKLRPWLENLSGSSRRAVSKTTGNLRCRQHHLGAFFEKKNAGDALPMPVPPPVRRALDPEVHDLVDGSRRAFLTVGLLNRLLKLVANPTTWIDSRRQLFAMSGLFPPTEIPGRYYCDSDTEANRVSSRSMSS